jgi:hypothetical protein
MNRTPRDNMNIPRQEIKANVRSSPSAWHGQFVQLEVIFISRVGSGVVGMPRRLATFCVRTGVGQLEQKGGAYEPMRPRQV